MATPKRMLAPATIRVLGEMIRGISPRMGDPEYGIGIGTHRELERFFKNSQCDISEIEGSIRDRTEAALDFMNNEPAKHDCLGLVLQETADLRNFARDKDRHQRTVQYLNECLATDGYKLEQQSGTYVLKSDASASLLTSGISEAVKSLSLDSVQADLDRALQAAEHDPADAITAACSTVESVCKCILDEMQQPYPSKQDIKGLVSEVGKHLNLSPARDDLPSELATDIKQILSGLISVTSGIGALRTHGGDAHGRGRKKAPVDARIARLAIHAASTVSLFYIETWNRMKSGSANG